MQTFLPYPSFVRSARCLDYRRLGKQRVEARQILSTLRGEGKLGWRNHPAVKMWEGYEEALTVYGNVMIAEWRRRGYKNSMELLRVAGRVPPPWIGSRRFHDSHKSNLLRKDSEYYGQFGWNVPDDLPYVWPTQEGESRNAYPKRSG